jgi:hypothetical protein
MSSRGPTTAGTTDAQPPTVADRLPHGADRLGIDADGRVHYWSHATSEAVVVELQTTASATVAHRFDVAAGAEFEAYLSHVAASVGWETLAYSPDGVTGAFVGDDAARRRATALNAEVAADE